ncbi:MAG TPA: sulfatase-like hydrolase/transferase [Anaerolineales bacterium]|nr:sulfatase-like hydrolase/transferase [Anaerolineales bacterium]
MSKFDRRSFLKLIGAAAPAMLLPSLAHRIGGLDASRPNIIVLLFDAMSARNLSLYGYPRPTSPAMERFAEHANVYHAHNSSGNYTIPGVASLMTGTYPWKHRAINHRGAIRQSMVENNLFRVLGSDYHRLAFPQNFWATLLLSQFQDDIDVLLSSGEFSELSYLLSDHFPKDKNMSARALDDFLFRVGEAPPSLVLGSLERLLYTWQSNHLPTDGYKELPHDLNYPITFRLEDVFDGLISLIPSLPAPFFTYLHLLPPHTPYRPTDQFFNAFRDDMKPMRKPDHRFADGTSNADLNLARRLYDEYIASLDQELGRLLDSLESQGLFENSYVILTADHGEMFERGEKGHSTPLLYDPVIHIPLLISAPGQKTRRDIYTPTNAVDILPTLAHLTGNPLPAWTDGKPLPGLGGEEDYERSLYSVEAKLSPANGILNKATVALRKGDRKLIYYTGYEAEDSFELYDLSENIEELHDLYPDQPAFAKQMKEELLEAFFEANKRPVAEV